LPLLDSAMFSVNWNALKDASTAACATATTTQRAQRATREIIILFEL
jgi:hypothetical protein